MRRGRRLVAVRGEQLSGANTQRECIARLELLQHLFLCKRSNGVTLSGQSLLPRSRLRIDVSIELAIEITLAQLQNLAQNVGRVCLVAIQREHVEDRVKPESIDDELANLRRLE